MKTWQVLGRGDGFVHGESVLGFDLSGFVVAKSPYEALEKAIAIAKRDWREISQAEKKEFPRPVINAEEVVDVTGRLIIEEDRIELYWDEPADT
ncbi:hypothetical protein [Dyella mobilis]|uniref:Uncharacterized protein n=1 Tax=Dyella mobilis TaxID=1849582 RepID=A0ABS2KK07_9GAMM|nr:hypothetical protein [Dyella mobilis]MBM7131263.1 hypothetical protein [Dyella mobilis]GLQ98800.1 hypothetical protein GCM10007863_32200 [Dyella mobilis]